MMLSVRPIRRTSAVGALLGGVALLVLQTPLAQAAPDAESPVDGAPADNSNRPPSGVNAPSATPGGTSQSSELSEIVVTALRRETDIEKTPLAITAVTGDQLARMGVLSSTDLQRVAPGLEFLQTSNGGSRVVIRNIQAAGEPVVGIYYGEVPVVSSVGLNNDAGQTTPAIDLFDIDRVEVLRGPQGTLYGSSSMAGTVRLLFNNAKVDTYEGAVATQGYVVDGGDPGSVTQVMANVPLINNLVGVRVVGYYRRYVACPQTEPPNRPRVSPGSNNRCL
jgi:iron complex outermembrane receptor protein